MTSLIWHSLTRVLPPSRSFHTMFPRVLLLTFALSAALVAAAPASSSVFEMLLAPHDAQSFLRHSYGKGVVTIHRNDPDHFASLRDAVGDTDKLVSAFRAADTLSTGITVRPSKAAGRLEIKHVG